MKNPNNKISMVVWNDFRNDSRVLKEAQTLVAAGWDVTVHALHTPGLTLVSQTLPCGIKVSRVDRGWGWTRGLRRTLFGEGLADHPRRSVYIGKVSLPRIVLRVFVASLTHARLLYQVVKAKPDVVHSHDVNTLPTAWFASVIMRASLVYDAHEISTDREGYASFRGLVGWVEKNLLPRASGIITTTDTRAKFFSMAYKIPRPIVLQNRPRLHRLAKSDRIRTQLGLTNNWPIVLYQGGLQQGRGLERLVDAARHVHNAYFVFIGGGRLEESLKEQVARLDLRSKVYFIETVSLDLLPVYTASADIGVQAIENTCLNHYSTDSNKLFEYAMAGLPVVATRLPEIQKIVHKYDFGIVVPHSNTAALVDAIQALVDNVDLRKRLGLNAEIARAKLSWEEQENLLVKLYEIVGNNS